MAHFGKVPDTSPRNLFVDEQYKRARILENLGTPTELRKRQVQCILFRLVLRTKAESASFVDSFRLICNFRGTLLHRLGRLVHCFLAALFRSAAVFFRRIAFGLS
jgi:hypothetical protein